MKKKIRISAVSYLNTLPFVYGIQNSGFLKNFTLQLDIPSECARKFINEEVEIALIPVGALVKLELAMYRRNFCIGANGDVKTVLLLSKVPMEKIRRIHLDFHSVTSVTLVKVLAANHWKINPKWIKLNEATEQNMSKCESVVAIGDKTFSLRKDFEFVYDLAGEWKAYTGLPFVFAIWVYNGDVSEQFLDDFHEALEWGVAHKKQAIDSLFDKNKFPSVDIKDYLENNIDFIFDGKKSKAMIKFLNAIKDLRKKPNKRKD